MLKSHKTNTRAIISDIDALLFKKNNLIIWGTGDFLFALRFGLEKKTVLLAEIV